MIAKNRSTGFTLLELMIVVVIIAILAAFAITNYARYGYRTRRADGKEMAMRVASAEERYYTNFNQYTDDMSKLGFTGNSLCNNVVGASEKCYYVVSVSTATGPTKDSQSFLATADPSTSASQKQDVCGKLTIDNTGSKTPLPGVMPANSNGNCW